MGGPVLQAETIHGSVYIVGSSAHVKQVELARTADELADVVQERWREEEDRREIRDPVSLPVRWEAVDDVLMDHWANIRLAPPGAAVEPLDLAGDLYRIVDVYRRIPSGRLVVLGRAGSGKTVLGLRLVLELLAARGPGEPVPEMFGIGSWNPTAEPLKDWLSGQLSRDQPGLATVGADGETLAAALVGRGLVLPILDGFDEIAGGLHRVALRELSATTLPLVLTSRSGEYAAAVEGTRGLTHAAAVELTDLGLDDLADYLLRACPKTVTPDWQHVLDELRHKPHVPANANLAAVLTTPLMVSLTATVYDESGRDGIPANRPTELLDTDRFPTSRSIENHLLGSFLPSVYRLRRGDPRTAPAHKWDPEHAQRWLRYLAEHLDRLGTRDLAWWEFGVSVRRWTRILVIASLSGLSFALVTGIGNIPVDLIATSHGLDFAVRRGIVVGSLHGLVAALAFGLVYRLADGSDALKPSPVRVRLLGGHRPRRAPFTARVAAGALVGFLAALALLLIDRLLVPQLGLDDGLGGGLSAAIVFPLQIGLSAGLALGLMTWLEAPVDVRAAASPADLLRSNRANVASHFFVWAVALGLVAGVVNSFTGGVVSSMQIALAFGIEGAFGAGLGYGLCLTAWGQWVALARIWLPLTGRLPWRLVAFMDDACRLGALRRAGAVYQFRHARLQDHLTGALDRRNSPPPTGASHVVGTDGIDLRRRGGQPSAE
ncbi:hypothetical protein [Saccharothrix sp. NRRL B-16314]|uniref:hypothetical protein n=1 Tax=Saccharothrix sp. NRRL B-16314 TaxID=1463825 RepID=UPI000AF5D5C5|nr:hypothetical protein [Saccharothrix sp. NRRL B-16314]